jgi:hypothetical protein
VPINADCRSGPRGHNRLFFGSVLADYPFGRGLVLRIITPVFGKS